MKKTLRVLSLVLAVMFVCMPLMSFADASSLKSESRVISTDLYRVDQLSAGDEYVIIGDDDASAFYALTTNPASSYLSTARVEFDYADTNSFGVMGAVRDSYVWIAVDHGGRIVLRNKLTGRYLGSLSSVYTWDSIFGADFIFYGADGFYQRFFGSMGCVYSYMLNYNRDSRSFYLTSSSSNCNVHVYAKRETAVVMPIAG
ncbi:MAG: hypothetical protein IIY70_04920 [Oscillospiraceae bacterium]|nr:hypothetical protein [Oscillospiraceae bacterium]